MNNLKVFENPEFGSIRTMEMSGEPWFVGKDVAEALGYKNGSRDINRHVYKEDRKKMMVFDGNQDKETIIINESGLYSLISSSKMATQQYKKDLVSWLKEENVLEDKNTIVMFSRREIEFLDKLETILSCFDVVCERQYKVFSYRIDLYIPSLNIAVEFDEREHNNYTYEQHEGRQHKIEKELGCKFVRVSDKDTDELNLGLVLKEIMEVK